MLSPDESHDAVDVASMYGRLHAATVRVQCRLDYVLVGKSHVVDTFQRHTEVSYVCGGHGRRHSVKTIPGWFYNRDAARYNQRLPAVVRRIYRDVDTNQNPIAQAV